MINIKASIYALNRLKGAWVLAFLRVKNAFISAENAHQNALNALVSCHEVVTLRVKYKIRRIS